MKIHCRRTINEVGKLFRHITTQCKTVIIEIHEQAKPNKKDYETLPRERSNEIAKK